ncbi:MAG: glycosyltransferase family 4 protein [Paenibacillus lautus]|uniref:glycosyltransferase family 4 protein n=1 Tax=Paenibacillus lautus TaxID=1401 RepID=UPI0026EA951A|nr:glycosyltransferase family 4 protein [Paenibacillus lautus]MCI1773932.1 glycosyltransferase family 4 protein [Paenibacillus lautus]
MKRNLVIINHVAESGGAENVMVSTLRHLNKKQFNVHVILFEKGNLVEIIRSLGYEVTVIDSGRVRNIIQYIKTVFKIVEHIRRYKADVVIGWASKPFIYAGVAAWLVRKPVIWWQHGYPSASSMFDRIISRIPADGILCPSNSVAETQSEIYKNTNIQVNNPGIDTEQYKFYQADREQVRNAYNIPITARVITYVGRLQRWKRPDDVIRAFSQITNEECYLMIVGGALFGVESEFEKELMDLSSHLGINHRVIFVGHQKEISKFLSASDIVINSSTKEPFGLVVVEAMSNGRVVIAVNSGGPAEIIDHNQTGFHYDGSIEDLYSTIQWVLDNKDLPEYIGMNARLKAQQNYSASSMTERFENILMKTIEKAG